VLNLGFSEYRDSVTLPYADATETSHVATAHCRMATMYAARLLSGAWSDVDRSPKTGLHPVYFLLRYLCRSRCLNRWKVYSCNFAY
jgi:hypothetical protein